MTQQQDPATGQVSGRLPSVKPDNLRAPDTLFLLGQQRQRQWSAGVTSVVGHILVFVIGVYLVDRFSGSRDTPFLPDLRSYDIVWIPQEGPGGGGGGGGNESLAPPVEVELPGEDEVSVPVEQPPEIENPVPDDEPEPEQLMNIPARTLGASSEMIIPGVLEGISASRTLSSGSGTGGGGGTGEGTGVGPGTGSGLGPGEGGGTGGGVYRPGSGIELPRPIREVKPQYTADAMRAKVQGAVWLDVVVLPDGTVGDVEVTRSLDPVFGLDQEAIKAARQWRFVPGTRFGQPVAVLVTIELTFTLR